ncbi:hypothetical protein WA026_020797 [Henosepilachna vigintioctopunctata]|uniref:Uncharacterized protein n=1 Tax=Henosepilachna vigintioctopunctata TaxID=420089 RepID=A0AAW1TQF7_9CUCU
MDFFSDDDAETRSERSVGPVPTPDQLTDEENGEYSDTADFIVDDDGHPISEFFDAALHKAQKTFGVDFDYNEEEYDEEDNEYENDEIEGRKKEAKYFAKVSRKVGVIL